MRYERVTFNEVWLNAEKSGVCPFCGKAAKRRKRFWQTLNPFNKNRDGIPKSRDEIFAELRLERNAWGAEPTYHQRCAELDEME